MFYSESRHEKESIAGAGHFSTHHGAGEEISAAGAARSRQAVCGVRRRMRTAYAAAKYGRPLLGVPPPED